MINRLALILSFALLKIGGRALLASMWLLNVSEIVTLWVRIRLVRKQREPLPYSERMTEIRAEGVDVTAALAEARRRMGLPPRK